MVKKRGKRWVEIRINMKRVMKVNMRQNGQTPHFLLLSWV
jgi:hypothetical protein